MVRVAGEVDLHHAVGGDRVDVLARVEAVVEAADVDVVDVEEEAAAAAVAQARQELPLRHRRAGEGEVGRRVLEDERALERVLHLLHPAASRGAASPRRTAAAGGRGCCGRGRPSSRGGPRPSGRASSPRAPSACAGTRGRGGRWLRWRARRRGARPGSARPRGRGRGAGRPPVSRKFSDSTSNQSTAGAPARISPKWVVRRPIPMPRSARPNRFMWRGRGDRGAAAATPAAPHCGSLLLLHVVRGHRAAALALAGVLAGAAVVAGLAPAQPLAGVLALAGVLRLGRGAAALALAGVLAGAAVVAGLAAALALAGVVALADVLLGLVLRLLVRPDLRSGGEAGRHRAHHLRELATLHSGSSLRPARRRAAGGRACVLLTGSVSWRWAIASIIDEGRPAHSRR